MNYLYKFTVLNFTAYRIEILQLISVCRKFLARCYIYIYTKPFNPKE